MDAQNSGKSVVKTTIGYNDPSSTTATGQVKTWKSGSTTYTYAYDARGNITSVSDGQSTTTYAYDSFDQLVRENNQAAGKTWTYAYDSGGNILSKTEYAYTTGSLGAAVRTVTYGYGDASWSDLLTSIGGQSLTADEIGNLLSDGTWAYTWQHGRQLAGMSKAGTDISYRYDADGLRISKTVNGTTYNYFYLGDQLVEMTWDNNRMHFTYDEIGPASVNYNGTEYFYVKNAQGDVTGLVNASGTRVVTYTYDAWGNPLTTTGSLATTLGEQNPLRYRGYVYDTETGLYYLQSRYYNPGWGRFINADSLIDNRGVHTQNVFAYCGNNPVNHVDSDGHSALAIVGIVCAGALIATASYLFVKTVTSRDFQNSWKAAVNSAICSVNGAIDRIQEKIKKTFEKARTVPSYKRYEEDHHIVAQKAKTAEPARRILEKVGINYYNDEVNHVMLKTGLHRRLHSKLYYAWVNDRITQAYERGEGNLTLQREYVIFELGRIRMELQVLNEFFPY